MRVESLTFLRFIAALIVVVSHFGVKLPLFKHMSLSGQLMVTFFFVLSGFVMTISQLPKKRISLKSYWLSRFTRIVPLYIFAMVFILCYFFCNDLEISNATIALNLFFLQSWFSTDVSFAINYPSWSLSVEVVFYFIFPFIVLYIKKVLLKADRAMLIAFLAWFLTQVIIMVILIGNESNSVGPVTEGVLSYHPVVHLCSFIFGIAGGLFFIEKRPKISHPLISISALSGVVLVIIICLMNETLLTRFPIALGSSFFAPLFLLLILIVACSPDSVFPFLQSPFFVLLGESSYALYILQIPLKSLYNNSIGGMIDLPPLYDFLFLLLFMVVGAVLSFTLFERPLNNFLRSLIPKATLLLLRRSNMIP